MQRALSLRARLILGVTALAAAGLLVAGVATYTSLRSFLVSRTDSALNAAHVSVSQQLSAPDQHSAADGGPGPPPHRTAKPKLGLADVARSIDRLTAVAPGVYVQVRRPDNSVVSSGRAPGPPGTNPVSTPVLPSHVRFTGTQGGEQVAYLTVPAKTGGGRYRVRASSEQGGYILIVASSLQDVDSTLHRLLLVEALVAAVVLAAIALLGLWVIRLSLRPLTAIGVTAATIAAGDLGRRVDREDERTEVGRLGLALNAMLGQIESAFRAREASEGKLRRFVADASHELRTPLAAVRAYAELFTRGAAERPDDLARSMQGITRESERMSVLVEDLLLLARLDEGRPLEREHVELRDVVAEAIETARAVDPGRRIDSHLDEAVVLGDRDRLRQVVDNLLSNVRAHTPAGAPVEVSLVRENGWARITVADSGPGLTGDEAEQIFERFYRADESRARASGGVGLGLSIVAAVTQAHGGRVAAHSDPGHGASFVVELPLERA